jgi:hypothetical protein
VVIGFHWTDEQTVQLEGTAAEIPQDHPAVAAVNPASSTCSTTWYSGSSSLPNPQARPRDMRQKRAFTPVLAMYKHTDWQAVACSAVVGIANGAESS